jgi:hypothetical protein
MGQEITDGKLDTEQVQQDLSKTGTLKKLLFNKYPYLYSVNRLKKNNEPKGSYEQRN